MLRLSTRRLQQVLSDVCVDGLSVVKVGEGVECGLDGPGVQSLVVSCRLAERDQQPELVRLDAMFSRATQTSMP